MPSSWQLFVAFLLHFNRAFICFWKDVIQVERSAQNGWCSTTKQGMVWLGSYRIPPGNPFGLMAINLYSQMLNQGYCWAPRWQLAVELLGTITVGVEFGFADADVEGIQMCSDSCCRHGMVVGHHGRNRERNTWKLMHREEMKLSISQHLPPLAL